MSDFDEKLNEIRERHRKDARWHCGPSMICPQSHDDRAFLLNEVTRLRARVEVLERVLHGIAEFCEEGDRRTFLAVANTARAALKEAKP